MALYLCHLYQSSLLAQVLFGFTGNLYKLKKQGANKTFSRQQNTFTYKFDKNVKGTTLRNKIQLRVRNTKKHKEKLDKKRV